MKHPYATLRLTHLRSTKSGTPWPYTVQTLQYTHTLQYTRTCHCSTLFTCNGEVEWLYAHFVHMIFVETAQNERDGVVVSHRQRLKLPGPGFAILDVKSLDVLQVLQHDPIQLDCRR